MYQVADVKVMMNPDLQKWFGATSHIHQCTAVSKPLHFSFERDGEGRGCMRTKMHGRQEQWSDPWYPLKCKNNSLDAPETDHKLSLRAVKMCVKHREVMSRVRSYIYNDFVW